LFDAAVAPTTSSRPIWSGKCSWLSSAGDDGSTTGESLLSDTLQWLQAVARRLLIANHRSTILRPNGERAASDRSPTVHRASAISNNHTVTDGNHSPPRLPFTRPIMH